MIEDKFEQELIDEAHEIIEQAEKHEIHLKMADFQVMDGYLLLDGMPADEWLEAMTMD